MFSQRIVTGCVSCRQRLVTDTVWLHAECGYTPRRVTGSICLQAIISSSYGQCLVTGVALVQAASGYGQRLVTDSVCLRTASG